jgi:hypothetical protein
MTRMTCNKSQGRTLFNRTLIFFTSSTTMTILTSSRVSRDAADCTLDAGRPRDHLAPRVFIGGDHLVGQWAALLARQANASSGASKRREATRTQTCTCGAHRRHVARELLSAMVGGAGDHAVAVAHRDDGWLSIQRIEAWPRSRPAAVRAALIPACAGGTASKEYSVMRQWTLPSLVIAGRRANVRCRRCCTSKLRPKAARRMHPGLAQHRRLEVPTGRRVVGLIRQHLRRPGDKALLGAGRGVDRADPRRPATAGSEVLYLLIHHTAQHIKRVISRRSRLTPAPDLPPCVASTRAGASRGPCASNFIPSWRRQGNAAASACRVSALYCPWSWSVGREEWHGQAPSM